MIVGHLSFQAKPQLFGIPYKTLDWEWRTITFLSHRTHGGVIAGNSHCSLPTKGLCSKISLCDVVIKDEAHIPMRTMWELLTSRGQEAC